MCSSKQMELATHCRFRATTSFVPLRCPPATHIFAEVARIMSTQEQLNPNHDSNQFQHHG
jgi:hypothetical protein